MKNRAWILIVLLLILPIAIGGCSKKQQTPTQKAPTVSAAEAAEEEVTFYMEYTGNSQAIETVDLRARVPGYLMEAKFQPSQLVKKGDLLFVIEQPPYTAALKEAQAHLVSAKAAYELAASTLQRKQQAYQNQAISALEISTAIANRDQAKAAMESAQAALEKALINLSYTQVRSPIDGRIGRRLADPGNLVGATGDTLLATVVSDDPMYVYFVVREKDFTPELFTALLQAAHEETNVIYMGMGQDGEDYPYVGKIDYVDNQVDPTTGTLQMRGAFSNPSGKLIPGMYVRLRMPFQTIPNAIMVPEKAVGRDQLGSYLLLVDRKNIVQYRSITVGITQDHKVQIVEGLKPGERYITEGLIKAVPGAPVEIQKSPASAVTPPAADDASSKNAATETPQQDSL